MIHHDGSGVEAIDRSVIVVNEVAEGMACIGEGFDIGSGALVVGAAAGGRAACADVERDGVLVEREVSHHGVVLVHGDGSGGATDRAAVDGPVLEGVACGGIGRERHAGAVVVGGGAADGGAVGTDGTAIGRVDRGGEGVGAWGLEHNRITHI